MKVPRCRGHGPRARRNQGGREAGSSGCSGGRRGGVSRWYLQSSGLDRGGREGTGGCGDILSSLSSSEHARAHKCAPSIKPPLRSVAMVTAFSLSLSLFGSSLLTSLCVRSFFFFSNSLPHPDMMSFLLLLKESFYSFEALFSRNSQSLHVCQPWQLQREGGSEGAVAPCAALACK